MAAFKAKTMLGLVVGMAALFAAGGALAADADFGRRLFDRCLPCHTVEDGGRHTLGPNLFGIVGRMAGTAEGYVYSDAMRNSGVTWTPENLAAFLEDANGSSPDSFIPGNRMIQLLVPSDAEIEHIIAYLQTLR